MTIALEERLDVLESENAKLDRVLLVPPLRAPEQSDDLELGALEGAGAAGPGHIVLESKHDGERISLSFDSNNGTLTVGGATRLMVWGVDVRERLQPCDGANGEVA